MPMPPYEGRRTYFFFADVEPKELMTFGVEARIQLDDDSTLEVLGHALAYWAIAEEQDVLTLRAVRPGRPRRDARDLRAHPPRP
ncbi:MAG: hypothetical protein ACRDLZ_04400 [Gaiellaceae bacterium]